MTFSGKGLRAGLKQEELWVDSILVGGSDIHQTTGGLGYIQSSGTQVIFSGTNVYVGGSAMALGYQLPVASIGSPVSKEQVLIQAGSDTTSVGSTVWLTYPTAFGKVPTVTVTLNKQAIASTNTAVTGSITTGSVQIFTTAASNTFNWIAVGGA